MLSLIRSRHCKKTCGMLQLVLLTNYLTRDQIRPRRQYAMHGNSLVLSSVPPAPPVAVLRYWLCK